MIRNSVEVDPASYKEAVDLFEFYGLNSQEALRIAINKTVPKVRTASVSAIRSQVRLSAAYVRERLTIKRANKSDMSAAIRTPKRGLLLSRFSTDSQIASDKIRWFRPPLVPKRGIKVKIKPQGQIKDAPSEGDNKPFYIVLKNSNAVGIAARIGKTKKLKVFHGPSLSQVFTTVREDVLPDANRELTKQMIDAMRYLAQKRLPLENTGADE